MWRKLRTSSLRRNIFMDEINSIGSTRTESGSGGGDSEVHEQTMLENQFDGFEPQSDIKPSSVGQNSNATINYEEARFRPAQK
jgi:ATP-dependent 26S proteasome regulatory subunit